MSQATYYNDRQAEDAMAILAGWMGQNRNIQVQYHSGTAVDADIFKGKIRIPRLACASGLTQEALMLLRTRVYHEAGHIDETKLSKRDYPKNKILFDIWNALEDRRMEAALAGKHKGCQTVFRWAGEHFNKKIAEQMNQGVQKPLWEALVAMGMLSDGITPAWNLTDKAQAYVDAAYDEFSKIRTTKNAKESVALAERVYEILKDAHKDYKQEQEQEQEQEQSQPQQNQEPEGDDEQSQDGGQDLAPQSSAQDDFEDEEEEQEKKSGGSADDAEDDEENESDSESGDAGDDTDEEDDEDSESGSGSSDESDDEEGEDEDSDSGSGDSDDDSDDSDDSDEEADSDSDSDDEGDDNSSDSTGDEEAADGKDESSPNQRDELDDSGDKDATDTDEQSDEEIEAEMEEESNGLTREEAENEELAEQFSDLDPADTRYLSRRDMDKHIVPESSDSDMTLYKDRRDTVAVMVAAMTRSLEQALRSLSRSRKKPYMRQGKIDKQRLVQIAKGLSKEVFAKTQNGMKLDVAVEIIIDESGSMHNWLDVQLMALAIGEALTAIHVPFEITGTTTLYSGSRAPELNGFTRTNPIVYRHYKAFGEQWNSVRSRIVHTSSHHHNIDGEAIEYCAFRLAQRDETRKIIFSLSDGDPCGGQGNDSELASNITRVCERSRKSGIEVYGFGIGTNSPRKYYGDKWFIYLDKPATMGVQFVRKFADIVTGGKVKV